MKIVVALATAAIIAATSAAFAKVVACDSAGHYEAGRRPPLELAPSGAPKSIGRTILLLCGHGFAAT